MSSGLGEASIALGDRWVLIEALLELRVGLALQSVALHIFESVRLVHEEAGIIAFAVGIRWAELDGHGAVLPHDKPVRRMAPRPVLIDDLPVLDEAFSAGYRLVAGELSAGFLVDESEPLLLSVSQVATYLRRPEHDILKLMSEGALACQWYGGERRVCFRDLQLCQRCDREDEERALGALLVVADLIQRESAIRVA